MQTIKNKVFVFLFLPFIILLTLNTLNAQKDKFIVVIDAGHGGKDPGRPTKYGFKEKDIALSIALKVGKELEKRNDFKVIYTRKKDVFLELRERSAIANKADADLFISIHCNAHNSQAHGTETWVLGSKNTGRNFNIAKAENEVIFLEDNYEEHYEGYDPSSPETTIAIGIEQEIYIEQSVILARKIEDNFKHKAKRKSRGLKQYSLWVLHNTYMPSVLVETGFITNKKEGAYLNSKNGQAKIANAIKDAIVDYKKEIDQNISTDIISDNTSSSENITETQIIEGVTFKVQIAASSRDLAPKAYNFKGLSSISKSKVGKLYKYYYGNTSDYIKIKDLQEVAKQKGYTTSYIVAFKNGKQIKPSEALKGSSN